MFVTSSSLGILGYMNYKTSKGKNSQYTTEEQPTYNGRTANKQRKATMKTGTILDIPCFLPILLYFLRFSLPSV